MYVTSSNAAGDAWATQIPERKDPVSERHVVVSPSAHTHTLTRTSYRTGRRNHVQPNLQTNASFEVKARATVTLELRRLRPKPSKSTVALSDAPVRRRAKKNFSAFATPCWSLLSSPLGEPLDAAQSRDAPASTGFGGNV